MPDIVGLAANVLQLIDALATIHGYIKDFHDAPKDQQRLLLEIGSLEPLVKELDRRIKSNQAAGMTSGLQQFEPLIQLKRTMERLTKKLDSTGISKVSSRVVWPLWGKKDIEEGLNTIERLKSLLNSWLGMDIWSDLTQEHRVAHNQTISNLKDATEEHRTDYTNIAKSIRDVALNQEDSRNSADRAEIIEWFSPLNSFLRPTCAKRIS
ncbi:hypothetical protein FB451DRAFT_1392076 [Mycena latifolia]|nr:hypothetical protein FB451DRAFT_1392076 [Mycena latifolia]